MIVILPFALKNKKLLKNVYFHLHIRFLMCNKCLCMMPMSGQTVAAQYFFSLTSVFTSHGHKCYDPGLQEIIFKALSYSKCSSVNWNISSYLPRFENSVAHLMNCFYSSHQPLCTSQKQRETTRKKQMSSNPSETFI